MLIGSLQCWPIKSVWLKHSFKQFVQLNNPIFQLDCRQGLDDECLWQVSLTQTGTPGWRMGKLRGASGWFPDNYVECIDEPVGYFANAEADTMQKTQLELVFKVKLSLFTIGMKLIISIYWVQNNYVTSLVKAPLMFLSCSIFQINTSKYWCKHFVKNEIWYAQK